MRGHPGSGHTGLMRSSSWYRRKRLSPGGRTCEPMTSDLLSLFKVTRLLISSRQRWARERGLPGEQGQRSDDRKQEMAEAMQRREGCRPLVEDFVCLFRFCLALLRTPRTVLQQHRTACNAPVIFNLTARWQQVVDLGKRHRSAGQ